MITTLHLQGDPKTIGLTHGTEGKAEVINSLEAYERFFKQIKLLSWKEAREIALTHLDGIEKFDLAILEEMEGIAKGAGVDFEDILTLNTRSEIALTNNFLNDSIRLNDGCTTVAMTSPLTDDLIIGQTWDWTPTQKKSLLLTHLKQEGKPDITMVTEGGIVGKIGYNSAGVGLCFNALVADTISDGLPLHIALRGILNSASIEEVRELLDKYQIGAAASLMLGYDDGTKREAVNYEVSPLGVFRVGGDEGWLAHTNHILSEELAAKINESEDVLFEGSKLRKWRIDELIQQSIEQNKVIDEQQFEQWFCDEVNKPYSINHHVDEKQPEFMQIETLFSIIINLTKKKALLRVGVDGEYVAI